MTACSNSQWAVTERGIESVPPIIVPSMLIEAPKLLQIRRAGKATFYEWPLHMAEKSWVELETFNEAFLAAVKHHAEKLTAVDQDMMRVSLAEAQIISKRVRRWGDEAVGSIS